MDLITKAQKEYSLVDSGDGEKLEKFGNFLIVRPESQAIWPKRDRGLWQKANIIFTKDGWKINRSLPKNFQIEIGNMLAEVKISKGRNIGIFPEYAGEWDIFKKILEKKSESKVLNLFAHTGLSSIACAKAGGDVVHIDASKISNDIAKNLADKNGVGDKIRFITEDCLSFIKREIRRGNKYDLIILDPPVFGRGSKGQVFKLEDEISDLVSGAKKLLSDSSIGIFLNGYASEYSVESYKNVLVSITGMKVIGGNLSIEEEGGRLNLPIAKWVLAFASENIKDIIWEQINK